MASEQNPTILVTGASGFVGGELVRQCRSAGQSVIGLLRSPQEVPWPRLVVSDWRNPAAFAKACEGRDVVVHCAARVHQMQETSQSPLEAFREVNVHATLALAEAALTAGVSRFVYVSSSKVCGEETLPGAPFSEDSPLHPEDPYGQSKAEAEQALRAIGHRFPGGVVIVRPPLVYGPGVKANFLALTRMVERGWPLPFGAIRNQRSLVSLPNLVSLLRRCIDHPAAANETFFASDQDDVSTPELIRRLAVASGRRDPNWRVPVSLLKGGLTMIGKGAMAHRLCSSLQVDSTRASRLLGWQPEVPMASVLKTLFAGGSEG